MKTLKYRTMLSVSGAMMLGMSPEATAQAKVSLQDAIDGMLADGCAAMQFNTQSSVISSTSSAQYDVVFLNPDDEEDPDFSEVALNKWFGDNFEFNLFNDENPRMDGEFGLDLINGDFFIPYTSENGERRNIFAEDQNGMIIQTFNIDIVETISIENVERIAPVFSESSAQLTEVCSIWNVSASQQTQTVSYTGYNFNFSEDGSGTIGAGPIASQNSGINTNGYLGSPSSSATRTQEGVARRQSGLSALIERLRRKFRKERAERYVQYAMLGDELPYMPQEKSYTIVTDAAGGVINLDRNPTELDSSAYSADSAFASIGAAVVFHGTLDDEPDWILGGSLGYETVDSSKTSGANAFSRAESETENISFSGFLGWSSSPFSIDGEDNARAYVTASATYGQGDQTYKREFEATYQSGVELNADDEYEAVTTSVFDQMTGGIDQSYWSGSLQATVSGKFENLTVAPRASVTYVKFKSDGLTEEVSSSGVREGTGSYAGGALALDYAPVEDEWVETRIGSALTLDFPMTRTSIFQVGASMDAVFVGDAETPRRTAWFAQDLRTGADRAPILYDVEDLDDQFYDVSVSASAQFSNGVQPYLSYFSRESHKYIDSSGVVAGVRFVY